MKRTRKCWRKLKQLQDRERAKAPYSKNASENLSSYRIENEQRLLIQNNSTVENDSSSTIENGQGLLYGRFSEKGSWIPGSQHFACLTSVQMFGRFANGSWSFTELCSAMIGINLQWQNKTNLNSSFTSMSKLHVTKFQLNLSHNLLTTFIQIQVCDATNLFGWFSGWLVSWLFIIN